MEPFAVLRVFEVGNFKSAFGAMVRVECDKGPIAAGAPLPLWKPPQMAAV